ncbi:MAG: hypothetical protein AB7V55_06545 [Oscillospiraceae bacterium]
MADSNMKNIQLNLLGLVCDRDKREKVVDLLQRHHSFFNLSVPGKGTANSRILGYLGLGETEKSVFFCVMPAPMAHRMLNELDQLFDFKKPGHGVAYLTSIHEGCYHRPVHLAGEENDGGETVEQQSLHDLIMVILSRGYTEEVMDVARRAGATGGTVLHARGCGLAGAEKFFGVTIQPEKEMLMILAKRDISCAIMGAIADETGPGTDANAISFSMAVNDVRGIGRDVPKDISQK